MISFIVDSRTSTLSFGVFVRSAKRLINEALVIEMLGISINTPGYGIYQGTFTYSQGFIECLNFENMLALIGEPL
jgi:hypothetical protein